MIGLLIDTTKCNGCQQCVNACAQAHNLRPDLPTAQDSPDGLSARRWITVLEQPAGHYVRKQCRHCLEPACVSACPVAAMQKTAGGPVVYDSSKCMGCRYCLMACPYGIPRYEWHTPVPYVRKCNLCYEHLQAGNRPACVDACPEQAVIFGEREVLLAEARHRLKAEPGRYIQKIDGEHEVGGTSILYISDAPLDFLGVNRYSGQKALPELTEPWLSQVPLIALGMTTLMAVPYWIIKRRMRLAAAREKVGDESVAKTDDEERGEIDE